MLPLNNLNQITADEDRRYEKIRLENRETIYTKSASVLA